MSDANIENMKKYFHYLIDKEMEKPLDEQDSDFITECVDIILILNGEDESCKLTKSDIRKAKKKILASANVVGIKNNHPKRLRRGVITAFAALVSLTIISGVTMAFDWEYSIKNLLNIMDVGETTNIEYGELSEINKKIKFDFYEDLINFIEYDVLYPTYLPDEVVLNKIYYDEEDNKDILFTFEYGQIELKYRLSEKFDWYDSVIDNSKILMIADFLCYTTEINNGEYQIVFVYNKKVYSFYSNDHNELVKIIENLNFGEVN